MFKRQWISSGRQVGGIMPSAEDWRYFIACHGRSPLDRHGRTSYTQLVLVRKSRIWTKPQRSRRQTFMAAGSPVAWSGGRVQWPYVGNTERYGDPYCVMYGLCGSKQSSTRGQRRIDKECMCKDVRCLTSIRDVLILRDLPGHLSMDNLGLSVDTMVTSWMQLAERLHLNIADVDLRCNGQSTWCAWGSATCK